MWPCGPPSPPGTNSLVGTHAPFPALLWTMPPEIRGSRSWSLQEEPGCQSTLDQSTVGRSNPGCPLATNPGSPLQARTVPSLCPYGDPGSLLTCPPGSRLAKAPGDLARARPVLPICNAPWGPDRGCSQLSRGAGHQRAPLQRPPDPSSFPNLGPGRGHSPWACVDRARPAVTCPGRSRAREAAQGWCLVGHAGCVVDPGTWSLEPRRSHAHPARPPISGPHQPRPLLSPTFNRRLPFHLSRTPLRPRPLCLSSNPRDSSAWATPLSKIAPPTFSSSLS